MKKAFKMAEELDWKKKKRMKKDDDLSRWTLNLSIIKYEILPYELEPENG